MEEGVGAVAVPTTATMDDLETWWAEVYEHARPTLLRALAASIGSFEGVEDAVQDAVADAISQQKTDVRSPEGWLYAVALNKLRGHRRRAAIFARLGLGRSTPSNDLDDALLRIDVSRRLLALPQRDRELLVAKSWRWLPGAASGSWSRNVFAAGDPSRIGDELILVRGPLADRNLRRAIWISLDSRIPEPDCNVGTPATARELATWIGSRSWLSATPPRRVTLEGIDALEIDITAVPGEDPPARCPLGDIYSRANGRFFIEVREAGTYRHLWVVEPGETIRLLLFDRFTGSAAPRTIGVTIQSPTESFDAMVADATPIVRALLSTLVAYPD